MSFWRSIGGLLAAFLSGALVALGMGWAGLTWARNQSKPDWALVRPSLATEPWGNLEIVEIPLTDPRNRTPDADQRLQRPRWFFQNLDEARLVKFFNTCELTSIQRRFLLDRRNWNIGPEGCTIFPPDQLVWFLSPTSRERIYSVLARDTNNYPQANAFRFPGHSLELKLTQAGLPVHESAALRRLVYARGGESYFSDFRAAQQMLQPVEFERVLQTFYAIPSYVLSLRVEHGDDVQKLVNYWGNPGRGELLRPLLQGLAQLPDGGTVNVSSLLPPFAQARLYTFPGSWADEASRADCTYSALNFFNHQANKNYLTPEGCTRALETDYETFEGDPQMGDLLVFMTPEGKAIHVCVYLAADFVFTKNGVNEFQPWVIMRLPDVLTLYFSPATGGKMLFLRKKVPAETV